MPTSVVKRIPIDTAVNFYYTSPAKGQVIACNRKTNRKTVVEHFVPKKNHRYYVKGSGKTGSLISKPRKVSRKK